MAGKSKNLNVDLTTGIGTISFPHLFRSTAATNDKGETVYDLQFIIPKTQRDDVRAILAAIKEVGEAKWGAQWKKVRTPLRDGDAEADELTDSGATKGETYPERLGCYFFNARSQRPVAVVGRDRTPILDSEEVYSGCKVKVAVSFYAYTKSGNNGIGVGLNGVQKIADGESLGGSGKPRVESMFDMLDDEDLDDGLGYEDEEIEEAPTKKAPAKKTPAKKAAAKKPAPVDEDDDLDNYDEDFEDDI